MKESIITFDRITILIDYIFIYLNHIKIKDKLKDKKNYSSAFEIYFFYPKYIFYILFNFIIVTLKLDVFYLCLRVYSKIIYHYLEIIFYP